MLQHEESRAVRFLLFLLKYDFLSQYSINENTSYSAMLNIAESIPPSGSSAPIPEFLHSNSMQFFAIPGH